LIFDFFNFFFPSFFSVLLGYGAAQITPNR